MGIYEIKSTGNRIVCDQSFVESNHPGDWEYVGEDDDSEAETAAQLRLDISADKDVAAIGEPVVITARLLVEGDDQVAPLTQAFAVPVEDAGGRVVRIKLASFTDGVATVPISFDISGYYRITEAGINRKLPPEARIALPHPFEVTVYE